MIWDYNNQQHIDKNNLFIHKMPQLELFQLQELLQMLLLEI
jgi:hypothetical protein